MGCVLRASEKLVAPDVDSTVLKKGIRVGAGAEAVPAAAEEVDGGVNTNCALAGGAMKLKPRRSAEKGQRRERSEMTKKGLFLTFRLKPILKPPPKKKDKKNFNQFQIFTP